MPSIAKRISIFLPSYGATLGFFEESNGKLSEFMHAGGFIFMRRGKLSVFGYFPVMLPCTHDCRN